MSHIILFFIAILMIVLVAMIFSRSQALQRFSVMEFLLVLILGCSVLLSYGMIVNHATDEYFEMFSLYLQGTDSFLSSMEDEQEEKGSVDFTGKREELDALLQRVLPISRVGEEEYRYMRAVLVKREGEGMYVPVLSLSNGEPLWDEIELQADECIRDFLSGDLGPGIYYYNLNYQASMGLSVEMARDRIMPAYALFVEMPMQIVDIQMEETRRSFLYLSLILWGIGTLLIGVIVTAQGRGMRKLVSLTSRVADGSEEWEALCSPTGRRFLESNEMRIFKNSLSQISFDMTRTDYMRFRTLQAYYRFAPKQIEKIFHKQSILEVGKADQTHMTGTMAFVSFSINETLSEQYYIRRMSENYSALEKAQKDNQGIFFSGNSDLSAVQLLFHEETGKAVQFGIDMAFGSEWNSEDRVFVLLHRGAFVYGVTGDDSQAYTYMLSKEMKGLERYMDRLSMLGISMIVTDSVYETVRRETASRYIGYIGEKEQGFKLYEILDACPVKERQEKINAREKFAKALELFQQRDYYLARNQFSEVLKESPEDKVARRYLFLCESGLNREGDGEASCTLFT